MTETSIPRSAAGPNVKVIGPRIRRHRSTPVRWYRRNERTVLGVTGVVGFFAPGRSARRLGLIIEPFFFSSPLAVLARVPPRSRTRGSGNDVRISSTELASGALAALVLAVPLGLIIGWYRRVGYTFDPWLNFFNSLPRIALLPLRRPVARPRASR